MPRIIKHNVATNSTTVPEFCHHGPKRSRHLSIVVPEKKNRPNRHMLFNEIYLGIHICMRIIVYIHICTYIYI